ncbi:pentapeptide repeat-containing protein [Actinomadura sp. 7K507]|uniref:pentapeptide repeat-containing protein n=1 Tax=Actinomadura sp. 7K507 TaxID=2530365 RepID=UPI001047DCF1|nr:pentapeptide repeat-containing protein [Actinomadura sp. 7K507]TDC89586.1 hypothetical protein E1285_16290 [Actinomadura sp. 7K507]
MSTDLYGVRVLDVDRDRREVRLRVFVVYYEAAVQGYCAPPERDWSFFLGLLWESGRWDGPIGKVIEVDQILDDDWAAANARWFIEDVEQTARRNDPPSPEDWEHIKDFYYERDGRWANEHRLVQADFTVRVTDACWIQHLSPGNAWGTTWYERYADQPCAEDVPHIPDLRNPSTILKPFEGESDLEDLAFSDDGRFLAVLNDIQGLVVYNTADWSERVRARPESRVSATRLMWALGRRVVTFKDFRDESRQFAFDVDTGSWVDAPLERGRTRSSSGRHRAEYGIAVGVEFLDGPKALDSDELMIEAAAFTSDESRLFVAGMSPDVFVLDPSTGEVLDSFADTGERVWELAVSPDGAYLVTSAPTSSHEAELEIRVRRTRDQQIVARHRLNGYVSGLQWSPDGRRLVVMVTGAALGAPGEIHVLPIGLPADPPGDLRPPPRDTSADHGLDPDLILGMALASGSVTVDELNGIVAGHGRWLASGGGGGSWQVLTVGALPLAVYRGPSGTDGEQAELRNRRFETGTDLRGLNLACADLTALVGESIDLRGADLRDATVTDSQLRGARLSGADLRGTDFSRADLSGADLTGAKLAGTDFQGTDLTDAKGI